MLVRREGNNGGAMATLGTRLFTFLSGKQVGEDAFGNRYFTERRAAKGRRVKRWVLYRGVAEASKVPALWHGWLHYSTDTLPDAAATPRYDWEKEHIPNLTGTAGAYVPPGHIHRGARRDASASDYEAWNPGDAA